MEIKINKDRLQVVLSEANVSTLCSLMNEYMNFPRVEIVIKFNVPYRKSYLYEAVFAKHGGYSDKVRNLFLCPLLELLEKDLNGFVTIRHHL